MVVVYSVVNNREVTKMIETKPNPFSPIEIWEDMHVRVDESDDEENMVNARHYHVRFVVGESRGRRYVDCSPPTR